MNWRTSASLGAKSDHPASSTDSVFRATKLPAGAAARSIVETAYFSIIECLGGGPFCRVPTRHILWWRLKEPATNPPPLALVPTRTAHVASPGSAPAGNLDIEEDPRLAIERQPGYVCPIG